MTQNIKTDDLQFTANGMPREEFQTLTDPDRDPALALPAYATDPAIRYEPTTDIPSIDDIDAALMKHVRGEGSPKKLIEELLHPFVSYPDLAPGKGLKRPTYQIHIRQYDVLIPRAPVRDVAERLHQMATDISSYRVGSRAPEDAPEVVLVLPIVYPNTVPIKAPTVAAARLAFEALTNCTAAGVKIQLSYDAANLPRHVLAARELMEASALGVQKHREQAIELVRATQDIRSAATSIYRRNEEVSPYQTQHVEISLGSNRTIEVSDNGPDNTTAHEKVAFTAKHYALTQTLRTVIDNHPILSQLPDNWSLLLSGEPQYLDMGLLIKCSASGKTLNREGSSIFEYAQLNELAEKIAMVEVQPQPIKTTDWELELGYSCRSKSTWNLTGPTLAQAIANDIDITEDRASMKLIDLLIDLYAGRDDTEAKLIRVLH